MISNITFYSLFDSPLDGCHEFFQNQGYKPVESVKDADIIIFNGGTDIGATIYGEKAIYTRSLIPSARDLEEMEIFNKFPNKFKVGICRGAQLLNCVNGGTLWQDVNNHGRSHKMRDLITGETLMVTSTHHQMMRPNLKDGILIGVSDVSTYKQAEHDSWMDCKNTKQYSDDHKDTEIVWYPKTRSLCVQGHPEYVPGTYFASYFFNLVGSCMNEAKFVAA